jgi:hypothetical protein
MGLIPEHLTSPVAIPAYKLDLKPNFIKPNEVIKEFDKIVQILEDIDQEKIEEEKQKRQSAERLAKILREQTLQEIDIRNTFKYNKKELRQELRKFRTLKSRQRSTLKEPVSALSRDDSVQNIESAPLIKDIIKKKAKTRRSPRNNSPNLTT